MLDNINAYLEDLPESNRETAATFIIKSIGSIDGCTFAKIKVS